MWSPPLASGRYQLAGEYRSKLSPADLQTFARISGVEQLFPTSNRGSWLKLLKPGKASFLVRDRHFEACGTNTLAFNQLDQAIGQRLRCQLTYTGKSRQVEPYWSVPELVDR